MKEKKFQIANAKYAATAMALLAFLFFIFAAITKSTGTRVFCIVLLCLSLLGGCGMLYLAYGSGRQKNYFLYDRRRKCKVSPKNLTFDFLNDKLSEYLSDFVEESIDLWEGFPQKLKIQLQADKAYLPPIAFRMLHDLSLRRPEDILAVFTTCDKKMLAFVCRAIKDSGDEEMASLIFHMKKHTEREKTRIIAFFTKNRRCFEGRIVHYIKTHIEEYEI
ncbi:MAG: hypothetical protein E7663_00725 [Ruminococcaceae bacterium]|nr:hypothetical protein [Oscillospiraceae bacterium]